MKFFSADAFYTALLLASSVNAFSFDLSKRALTFDPSCNTKYGSLTAKQLIDKSIDFQPKLAKAGKDGLDTLIAALEYQSKAPGAKKPSISKGELDTIIATYRVLFGDIQAKNADGTENPNFKQQAADHIAAIKVTRDSLTRMTKSAKPNLIIHCNDDWLSERGPKNAGPKPAKPLSTGSQYFFDMDRKRWVAVKGGKPCQGNKAAVTSMNKKEGTSREKGPERITFCKEYLKRQQQLEKDQQPHIWDVSKAKLPDTFTTYNQAGRKDKTLPFHISAFGKKIGAKWFHEFMHTELFHPDMNKFSDKKVPDSQGGTGGVAYGFEGAVGLAKNKGIAESSRNIENILYWSLAMYYDKWVWSTGKPEDPKALAAPPAKRESIDEEEEFQVLAGKKAPKKPTKKPDDPPKTEAPPPPPKTEAPPPPPKTEAPPPPPPKTEAPPPPPKTEAPPPPPPKTEAPVEPPKTDKPADPPKTSAAPPPPPPSNSQAPPPPPATSGAAPTPDGSPKPTPLVSASAPPGGSATAPTSVPQTTLPASGQMSGSRSALPSISSQMSGASSIVSGSITASISSLPPSSCSNTLCTMPSSSVSPTSSEAVPQETFESEPMDAGSMTENEILAIAGTIASEQLSAMTLWDQALTEMGLPSEPVQSEPAEGEPVEGDPTVTDPTVGDPTMGDPTASLGTGLPMATGGAGGASNGTWTMPALRARERTNRNGVRERRMYDFAS